MIQICPEQGTRVIGDLGFQLRPEITYAPQSQDIVCPPGGEDVPLWVEVECEGILVVAAQPVHESTPLHIEQPNGTAVLTRGG